MAALGQFIGGLLAGQRLLRQLEAFVVRRQGQPGSADFGDQADLRTAPGFGQRQIRLQCFVLKVFDRPNTSTS